LNNELIVENTPHSEKTLIKSLSIILYFSIKWNCTNHEV